MRLTSSKKFFLNVIRRTGTLRIGFPNQAVEWENGNQCQRSKLLTGQPSSKRGRVLLNIRLLLSLNAPKIQRIVVLYLSEVKDRFPFLDRKYTTKQHLDLKGSCMEYVRPAQENSRFGNLGVASVVEAYVKRPFRHHGRQKRSTWEESWRLLSGQFRFSYDRGRPRVSTFGTEWGDN